jgi:hypothetical protein
MESRQAPESSGAQIEEAESGTGRPDESTGARTEASQLAGGLERLVEEAATVLEERRQRYSELSDAIVAHADLVIEHLRGAAEARSRLEQAVRALWEEPGQQAEAPRRESIPDAGEEAQPGKEGPAGAPEPAADARPAAGAEAPADGSPSPSLEEAERGERESEQALSGARLLALHMAVAGESRADAERYLRPVYGIDEPEVIVEEIFARYETRE